MELTLTILLTGAQDGMRLDKALAEGAAALQGNTPPLPGQADDSAPPLALLAKDGALVEADVFPEDDALADDDDLVLGALDESGLSPTGAPAPATALAAPPLSRARIQALLREGCVTRDGAVVSDFSLKVRAGQVYAIKLPDLAPTVIAPQDIPLNVVFEDEHLLVINKPAGLVVHPGAGNRDGTLVNALLAHCGTSLSGIGGVARPGIVHRLDKDTSGLLVVAKHDAAHQGLVAQFADRRISRTYVALVWGAPSPLEGQIEEAIGRHPRSRQKMSIVKRGGRGGKEALTFYRVLDLLPMGVTLVECKLATGRTHQIRVHMAHVGHPLVGDPVYGRRRLTGTGKKAGITKMLEAFPRQALHAAELRFTHPMTKKILRFKAPIPPDMEELVKQVKAGG